MSKGCGSCDLRGNSRVTASRKDERRSGVEGLGGEEKGACVKEFFFFFFDKSQATQSSCYLVEPSATKVSQGSVKDVLILRLMAALAALVFFFFPFSFCTW